jgi:hypothetical protein
MFVASGLFKAVLLELICFLEIECVIVLNFPSVL